MNKNIKILLTNDDSHDSPLFHHTIAALAQIGRVDIVVPAAEQSWKGKAMTRVGPLYADRIDLHGTPAWSVTGTPADCVNIAIHNLLDEQPDIVVSGTNIGKNVGAGFIFSSGTVGACFEANIAGLPALALSQELAPAQFQQWMETRSFLPATAAELSRGLDRMIPLVWTKYCAQADAPATTWNINFPSVCGEDLRIINTRVGHTFYGRCFTRTGDQFHHDLSMAHVDQSPDTDDCVVCAGNISATEIDIRALGQNVG